MGKTLDSLPLWNQRADPSSDGHLDTYFTADCGEECCSIVQFGLGAGYTTESEVRLSMPGHKNHGETTSRDLTEYLTSVGLSAVSFTTGYSETRILLKKAIDEGKPCIVLGYFVSTSILHWVVVMGYGNGHVLYIDPWDGTMKAVPWTRFGALYAGVVVEVSKN